MPELPEVETIKNAVADALTGAVIEQTLVYQRKFRIPLDADFADKIQNCRIESFSRFAKYMMMHLSNHKTVIWHFGMSGKIKIESTIPATRDKHDHVIIKTDKGVLIYNDPRRFGLVTICDTDKLKQHPLFAMLGLDPWDKNLNKAYLLQKFSHKKTAVKIALLDQSIINGIGNIYASEILYHAGINPNRSAESVSAAEAEKIIKYTRQVLEAAIKAGGSTIHDYKHPDNSIGYFQESHCVYNKTGLRCPQCCCDIKKTGGIQKTVLGGRSTFYCATLQK